MKEATFALVVFLVVLLTVWGILIDSHVKTVDDRLITLQHTPTPNVQALETRVAELQRTPTP